VAARARVRFRVAASFPGYSRLPRAGHCPSAVHLSVHSHVLLSVHSDAAVKEEKVDYGRRFDWLFSDKPPESAKVPKTSHCGLREDWEIFVIW